MSYKKVVLSLGMMAILILTVAFSLVRASSVEIVQVGALSQETLVFNLQTGQKFTGSLAISGGSGNDIDFWVTNPTGATILNLGRVS
jgi:ligand-binding SRPBCC domain-containing protein